MYTCLDICCLMDLCRKLSGKHPGVGLLGHELYAVVILYSEWSPCSSQRLYKFALPFPPPCWYLLISSSPHVVKLKGIKSHLTVDLICPSSLQGRLSSSPQNSQLCSFLWMEIANYSPLPIFFFTRFFVFFMLIFRNLLHILDDNLFFYFTHCKHLLPVYQPFIKIALYVMESIESLSLLYGLPSWNFNQYDFPLSPR